MQAEKQFYDEKFYVEEAASSTNAAQKILPLVAKFVDVKSVLDVGCGVGMFLKFFLDGGVQDIQGVDGDYIPAHQRRIPGEKFYPHDLKTPLQLNRRFDLVMSLEVAEHIAGTFADQFVASLCDHGDVVLFSAAAPGQTGTNHINEQWPDYWAAKFVARGYTGIDCLRPILWADSSVDYWYRQNTILFATAKGLEKNPRLAEAAVRTPRWGSLNIVHPEMYLGQRNMLYANSRVLGLLQNFINELHSLNKKN